MATVAPSWAYSLHLPHDPRAPGIARATLRSVLAAHEYAELAPTAELLASELVTNANLHTTGPYALRLMALEPRRLRIGVWDTDPRIPDGFTLRAAVGETPRAPVDAEGGRGLHLVRTCADAWGAQAACFGKVLWAECR